MGLWFSKDQHCGSCVMPSFSYFLSVSLWISPRSGHDLTDQTFQLFIDFPMWVNREYGVENFFLRADVNFNYFNLKNIKYCFTPLLLNTGSSIWSHIWLKAQMREIGTPKWPQLFLKSWASCGAWPLWFLPYCWEIQGMEILRDYTLNLLGCATHPPRLVILKKCMNTWAKFLSTP